MANATRRYGAREMIFVLVLMGVIIAVMITYSGGGLITDSKFRSLSAPEIEFEMPDGKGTSVHKLKGTVLLLNFWASWCAPCIEEMPSLRMLEQHLKDRGFVLLAFNISESKEQIRGRLGGTEMPDNLIFNFDKEFLRPYEIGAIPVSVLVDSAGIIRQVYSGPRNWLDIQIRREIEKLLNK